MSAARRSVMFSPTLAMVSAMASATVMLPTGALRIFSTSGPVPSAALAIIFTRPWNRSLRATKSVSELTSTRMPLLPAMATPIRPSAATRPAFLAALDSPFLRSQSTAASRLPPLSLSAALQSIMPAPVWSRSSLTMPALMFAMGQYPWDLCPCHAEAKRFRRSEIPSPRMIPKSGNRFSDQIMRKQHLLGLGRLLLRLGHPAFDAAGEPNLFADLVRGDRRQFGDLP